MGSSIAREILDGGMGHVVALKRHSSSFENVQDIHEKIEWVEGDINCLEALSYGIDRSDYVIHAAAIVSFAKRDLAKMQRVNIEGTRNVVELARKANIKKLCHISSIAAIGEGHNSDESTMWDDLPHHSPYSLTKTLAEWEVWRAMEEGLNAVIVNPSAVIGKGNWNNSSLKMFQFIKEKNISHYPTGTFNFIDNRDLSTLCIELLHSDIYSERFIINGGSLKFKEVIEKVCLQFGKKAPKKPFTDGFLQTLLILEKLRSIFLNKKPMLSKSLLETLQRDVFYDSSKVKHLFNFTFRSFDETLDWALN